MKRKLWVLMSVAAIGCAGQSDDGAGETAGQVVGVTDLSSLERELGLEKDTSGEGHWKRSDALLKAGGCYKKTVGAESGWEFRRYVNGAAFFKKENVGGQKRPVVCVDVDVKSQTVSLSGSMLDLAYRHKMGKLQKVTPPRDAFGDETYFEFAAGTGFVVAGNDYCAHIVQELKQDWALTSEEKAHPAVQALTDAIGACKTAGGDDASCRPKGEKACQTAAAEDIARDLLVRPSSDDKYVGKATKGTDPEEGEHFELPGDLMAMVYRYAWKSATEKDIYTMADDPVGRWVTGTYGPDVESPTEWSITYDKVEAKRVYTFPQDGQPAKRQLTISPKGGGAPLAQCTAIGDADYQCTGID